MLTLIVVGFVIVGLTITVHASGTQLWVQFLIRRYAAHDGPWTAGDR